MTRWTPAALREERDGQVVRVPPQHRDDDLGLADVRFLEHRGNRGVPVQRDQAVLLGRPARHQLVVVDDGDGVPKSREMRGDLESGAAGSDDDDLHRASFIPRPVRHRSPQEMFVDRGDVPGRGAVGDQAAPGRVEDRGLAGGEHGGQRDVGVRVLARRAAACARRR